jgi:putative transcriptional regulator
VISLIRLLCLWLLLGPFAPAFAAEPAMKSILLIAREDMRDPFFRDSVVLVTNPGGSAPMGVIINRPTQIPLARIFPEVERLKRRDDKVFFGGPVKRDEVIVVFRAAAQPPDSIEVLDGVYLGTKRTLALEILARDDAAGNVRAFAGHAGWAPGQLEAEIASGTWHLARADAATVFGRNPDKLWQELERRARDKTAALSLSRAP